MRTMAEAWHEFVKANVPADASSDQYYSMKSAFYGGGFCFLKLVESIPEDASDDALHGIIQGCNDEMTAYFDEISTWADWPKEKT